MSDDIVPRTPFMVISFEKRIREIFYVRNEPAVFLS